MAAIRLCILQKRLKAKEVKPGNAFHSVIIPARAGSKSIVNKNLCKIGLKSLSEIAAYSAVNAGFFDEILFSTDIESLLKQKFLGDKINYFKRDDELCTDTAKMSDVVMDAIGKFKHKAHYIWVLQPTSPFRKRKDFLEIKEIIENEKPSSLISVRKCDSDHPNRTYTIVGDELKAIRFTNFENRQQLVPVYIRNGCFYVVRFDEFLVDRSFYLKPCRS